MKKHRVPLGDLLTRYAAQLAMCSLGGSTQSPGLSKMYLGFAVVLYVFAVKDTLPHLQDLSDWIKHRLGVGDD